MNSNDWWDGSISQVPGSGTTRPLTTRVPGVVPTPSLMLVSSLGTDDVDTTFARDNTVRSIVVPATINEFRNVAARRSVVLGSGPG